MLGVVAVITNCALIGMAAKSAHWLPEMSTVNAILMFVAIEVRTRHSLPCGCFFSSKRVIEKRVILEACDRQGITCVLTKQQTNRNEVMQLL